MSDGNAYFDLADLIIKYCPDSAAEIAAAFEGIENDLEDNLYSAASEFINLCRSKDSKTPVEILAEEWFSRWEHQALTHKLSPKKYAIAGFLSGFRMAIVSSPATKSNKL